MSWFNTLGPCPQYVLYSKVTYTRNIHRLPFCPSSEPKRLQEVLNKTDKLLTGNGFKCDKLAAGINHNVLALAEKQFVGRDFVMSPYNRTVYINEPCSLLVAVGGKNFISINSIVPGQAVNEAKNIAAGAEEILDAELDFAYLESIGYLCENPTECGSGIEFCSALYLPSIRLHNDLNRLRREIENSGARLYPMFDYHDNPGDLYILCFRPQNLADENTATRFFNDLTEKIVVLEKSRLRMIFSETNKIISDRAKKALGTMLYAESLHEEELLGLLSNVRLCLCLGGDSNSTLPSPTDLNFILIEGLTSSITVSSNRTVKSNDECNVMRAELARKFILSRQKQTTAVNAV